MIRIVVLLLIATSCAPGEHRAARVKYNDGVGALARGEYEAAIKSLLEARSQAGVDPELRFRAAYDLGLAYLAQSDKIKADPDADLAKALELATQAVSWLGDAGRQRPKHGDTQANLAIARARMQALSDELRKGEGKLEARIDRAIRDQRAVLDGVRDAWLAIKKTGGSDPLAQQGRLTHLADTERGIVAEVGAISDLASDEIDAIAMKPEDKRSDDEKVRVVQLKNIDLYLIDGRGKIAEARRKLQELAAEDALGRAEAALVALKRAREQLLDPRQVLGVIAQEELALLGDTVTVGGGPSLVPSGKPEPPELVPAWLEPAVLAGRQGGLRDRLDEVRARLAAAVSGAAPEAGAPAEPAAQPDPEQEKVLARIRIALPSVAEAIAAMDRARQTLADDQLPAAIDHERAALVALMRAIEEFADLKKLIDLAFEDQVRIVAMLGPEAAKELPAAERATATRDALARNLARMGRLQELIAGELAKVAQQEQQLAAQAGAAGSAAGTTAGSAAGTTAGSAAGTAAGSAAGTAAGEQAKLDAARQQLEAARQRFGLAESLRGQARTALEALEKALARAKDPLPPANDARDKLEELRKLFFSVIEHLQQLVRDQGETRDQTSSAMALDPLAQAAKVPPLITLEEGHVTMAKAITDALAAQADAQAGQPPQPGGTDAKTLVAAADEVRLAQGAMGDARATLVKARDATSSTESLAPAVEAQATAIEHLENALRLLQPPKPQNKQQDQDQQQQEPQPPQPQPQAGAGQAARDQDAAQQRKRREREATRDPVEKDW